MLASLLLYNLAGALVAPCLPAVWLAGRLSGRLGDLWPRVGLYSRVAPAGPGPRVWLQAVSVGEVNVARAVAGELWKLCPQAQVTISCGTGRGLVEARKGLDARARVMPFPLDFPWSVVAAWRKARPQVYASLETELWPNLLAFLQSRGVGLLLLNGRLSPRSFPGYQKARCLVAPTLGRFDWLSMIGPEDAERVLALGAPASRVRVDGNAKYAGLADRARPELREEPARLLALEGAPLLVAGSVRSGEEGAVLGAFAQARAEHPNAVLAVAPRHVERAGRWLGACGQMGLPAVSYSRLEVEGPRPDEVPVVVVDRMGVLLALYGLAVGAMVGASLVPLGGQNPMEPAAWGVPVAHGPSMEDFSDAAGALGQAGAARLVENGPGLARVWSAWLADPQAAQAAGEAGRQVVERWSGAAAAAAGLIMEQLKLRGALS